MKANACAIETQSNDEGVSPVIAVILMVAITVVLAATVYVWVSGFSNQDTGPEDSSITARGMDTNDDGSVDFIRLTLTKGENAPYDAGVVALTMVNGTDVYDTAAGDSILCTSPVAGAGSDPIDCSVAVAAGTDNWDVGETWFAPCQGDGRHTLTVSIRDTTVLDTTVACDAAAP